MTPDGLSAFARVDAYLASALLASDPALDAALAANATAGLPAIDVSPVQGKLLMLLCRLAGARRVLEVGTLGGYSTIWLARGVGTEGSVVTLEISPHHAAVAVDNLVRAGVGDRVEVVVGPAVESLARLTGPFDVVFLDADKPGNPAYLQEALRLSRPGTLIIGDNVVRAGRVLDADSDDPNVVGTRTFLELLGADSRLDATALQMVGSKGWDGFALAVVT
jgi:predicted O-methyltransferase YrrM